MDPILEQDQYTPDPNEEARLAALRGQHHIVNPLTGKAWSQADIPTTPSLPNPVQQVQQLQLQPVQPMINPMIALNNAAKNSTVLSPAQKSIIPPPVVNQPSTMPAISITKNIGIGAGAGTEKGVIGGTNTGISGQEPVEDKTQTLDNAPTPKESAKNMSDYFNNPQNTTGISKLYSKAQGIQNPFLRTLGEIGVRGVQTLGGIEVYIRCI